MQAIVSTFLVYAGIVGLVFLAKKLQKNVSAPQPQRKYTSWDKRSRRFMDIMDPSWLKTIQNMSKPVFKAYQHNQ